jgi:hypothetical protein
MLEVYLAGFIGGMLTYWLTELLFPYTLRITIRDGRWSFRIIKRD